ncbi:hypothetical protein BGZ95_005710 [Linnemannia exigua]|uniref:F-box domain-containing protein n=1 Tax=Linnemannia exigua TaxID=604196 RepID=A0AAD4DIS4_9FUNG|nr:hypothetical protein BGZ95_005710 [Linnemannia exigua]
MDPLSQLPLECLYYILNLLVQDSNTAALAALLSTNRYFATVASSVLYKEPYQFTPLEASSVSRYKRNTNLHTLIHRIPTRTLFNSLPTFTILPKVVSLGLEPVNSSTATLATTIPTARPPTLDYLTLVQHLNQVPWAVGVDQLWKWSQAPPGVASFIITDEFVNQCQDANLIPDPSWVGIDGLKLEFYQRCFQILFFRESSWVIAEPILEQLQSLTVPLSVVAKYLESPVTIQRLKRLDRFHFIMDKVSQNYNSILHRKDEASRAREDKEEDFLYGPVVRFVKEHTRFFPGVMKTAFSSHGDLWAGIHVFEESCPDRILIEINRMLSALLRPIILNTHGHLIKLLAHPVETDLSGVVELDCCWVKSEYGKHALQENNHFLQRCRKLRKLKMEPVKEGTFKWAVDEKRLSDQAAFSTNGYHNMQDILVGEGELLTQGEFWRMGLAPLEDIQLSSTSRPLTDEVNDVAVAFSQTLKHLLAISWSICSKPLSAMYHVGNNWVNLPLLTSLFVRIDGDRLVIAQDLILHCPNLVSLYLSDETLEYQCKDIQQSCQPAILPCLESLTLNGWPALTFHPATLHSTSSLKELTITCTRYMMDQDRYSSAGPEEDDFIDFDCYIPPIAELYNSYNIPSGSSAFDSTLPPTFTRPKWSWDWDLPHLTSLTLTSEFAAIFEFRMLLGCPVLETLEIEWRTRWSSYTRTISRSDLVTPSGDAIVVPSLTKLRMHGPCLLDPSCSNDDQFVAGMFPNLKSLSALQWGTFPLDSFTRLVKTMPSQSLKELFLCQQSFVEDRKEKELKLVRKEDAGKYEKEDVLAAVSIGIVPYVLLR